MRYIFIYLLIPLVSTNCWSGNPLCWIKECKVHTKTSWKIFFSNYNPYCVFWECSEYEQQSTWKIIKDWSQTLNLPFWPRTQISAYSFNPYCWLYDCDYSTRNLKSWTYFPEFENAWFPQDYNPVCWVGLCTKKRDEKKSTLFEAREPSLWSRFKSSSSSVFDATKDWVGSIEPRKAVELLKRPFCWFKECCDEYHIHVDMKKLKRVLETQVHGQPLISTVADAINSHWQESYKPTKALVISFHGWVGSGKTFVSNLIAESLFRHGTESYFFHHFQGRKHFTLEDDHEKYKENLRLWLRTNVRACPKQLFVFDEADKMPGTLLDSIKPMMDYRPAVDGVDYARSVFLLISNAGSQVVLEQFERLTAENKGREEIELKDFERLVLEGAFNEKGGLHHSEAINENLIDHYIPFLPLERKHIVNCTKDEFRKRNVELKFPRDDYIISEIVDSLHWDLGKDNKFSKTGCKLITSKVAVALKKYFRQKEKTDL